VKIAVVGGGPSGLYCALLVKKRRPGWTVVVVEQNASDATFGFGVVLGDSGLSRIRAADADVHARLVAKMTFNGRQHIVQRETPVLIKHPTSGGAIARIDLLHVLQAAAAEAGVDVRYGTRVDSPDQLADHGLGDADVVIGADGINSVVRAAHEAEFGTTRSFLTNHFAWFGTDRVFQHGALVFRRHQGGSFVAHYYPYCATGSTFVAECDDATWKLLGMERMTGDECKTLFEEVFARELDGHALISNNSNWRQFPVVRNRQWLVGRNVLLGDAQASAHFSIGSGTRIAMEDSIALAEALTGAADGTPVATLLQAFADTRGPEKTKLIGASERSYLWYERIGEWIDRYTPHEFIYAFMTRTGRMNDARLAAQYPELFQLIRPQGQAA
jgi:2-polyprenyl-6-methoxyphenol hydroxylase-like FAD-dependent oxidoreductase